MRKIELIKNNEFINRLVNNLFLIVLPIVLLLMSFSNYIFFIVFIIYLIIFGIKYHKTLFFILIILMVIISLKMYSYNRIYNINRDKNIEINLTGLIIDKSCYDSSNYKDAYYKYEVKCKVKDRLLKQKILLYSNTNLEIGNYVYIEGRVREIDGEKIKNSFDYENYLNKSKIYYSITGTDVKLIKDKFTIYKIKKIVNEYFGKHFSGDTLIVLKGLILGDSSGFTDSLTNSIRENGILHLFAVSGLHISLFITMLSFALSILKIDDKKREIIIIVFLFLYNVLTSFSVSIVRASLMYLFGVLNNRLFDKVFTPLDVVSFTFILLIIINPYYAYNTGFILSFMVSFVILLLTPLIREKSNSYQIFIISLISNLFTLPIIININYEYNLLTPLINVLYINLVSMLILPLGFIVLVLPILSIAYNYIIKAFLLLINFTSKFSIPLHLPHLNSLNILIFYCVLLLIIIFYSNKRYKRILFFTLFVFIGILSLYGSFTITPKVDFLYLNDGDAIIIQSKNNVVLIDAGDGYNDEVYNALKSKGIRKIDYLIITHNHNDHYGGLEKIVNKINVKNIVTSCYLNSTYKNKLIVYPFDELESGDIHMIFLSPIIKRDEENGNSLTCLVNINNKKMLFMGDATFDEEKDIIHNLKVLGIDYVDVLKIGHHGSDTSTSKELLDYLKVDNAVIMVGKKRILTHPNVETIEKLDNKNINYFVTTKSYSISLKVKKNKSIIISTLKD